MFRFTVTPDADTGVEPFDFEASTRDLLVWEKTGKGKTIKTLLVDMPMVELYRLAHLGSRRRGLYDGTLQEFEETCDLRTDRLGDDEDDDAGPTQSDHSTGE